jgi:hypothetical protein
MPGAPVASAAVIMRKETGLKLENTLRTSSARGVRVRPTSSPMVVCTSAATAGRWFSNFNCVT